MYLVIRQGVYQQQGVIGCFTSDQIAKKCAENYANNDTDSYYKYEVYAFVHDIAYKNDLTEHKHLIYTCRKNHEPVSYMDHG